MTIARSWGKKRSIAAGTSFAQRDNLLRLDTNHDGAITLEEAKRQRR